MATNATIENSITGFIFDSLKSLFYIISQTSNTLQFDKLLFRIITMMRKKNNIVVGLTTFNTEMLGISVPALGKLRQKFMLIIYNDNPMTNITRRQIRKLGYCGDLTVINSDENIGEFRARMAIVDAAREMRPDWIVFCDDDDILSDIDIPNVSDDNFAVIQNAIILRHRVGDLLRAMENPNDIEPDGENTELVRPHVGLAGTPVRVNILFGLARTLPDLYDMIHKIDEKLDFYPPVDAMMWNFVNIYARHQNHNAVPIYMDKINYIKNELDTVRIKYNLLAKPARNIREHYHRALDKYNTALHAVLDAAALRG